MTISLFVFLLFSALLKFSKGTICSSYGASFCLNTYGQCTKIFLTCADKCTKDNQCYQNCCYNGYCVDNNTSYCSQSNGGSSVSVIAIVIPVVFGVVLILGLACCIYTRRRRAFEQAQRKNEIQNNAILNNQLNVQNTNMQMQQYQINQYPPQPYNNNPFVQPQPGYQFNIQNPPNQMAYQAPPPPPPMQMQQSVIPGIYEAQIAYPQPIIQIQQNAKFNNNADETPAFL